MRPTCPFLASSVPLLVAGLLLTGQPCRGDDTLSFVTAAHQAGRGAIHTLSCRAQFDSDFG